MVVSSPMRREAAADDGDNVLVGFDRVMSETEKAKLLAISPDDAQGVWIPSSQIASIDADAGEVWIPLWLAEAKGLEYR